jgi:hypothetical protein
MNLLIKEMKMRFLTALSLILTIAVATATIAQAQYPVDTIKARSDKRLPANCDLQPIAPAGCGGYTWALSFYRTDRDTCSTIIRITAAGLDMDIALDSDIYLPGWYSFSGKGAVRPNALVMPKLKLVFFFQIVSKLCS